VDKKYTVVIPSYSAIRMVPTPAESCIVVEILGDDLREARETFYAIFTPKTADLMKDGLNFIEIIIQDDNDGNFNIGIGM